MATASWRLPHQKILIIMDDGDTIERIDAMLEQTGSDRRL
jgi:hypothetical protein